MQTLVEKSRSKGFEKIAFSFSTFESAPFFLTLFTVGLSYFRPTAISALVPFVAIVGLSLARRAKRTGLLISLLATAALYFLSYKEDATFWNGALFFSLGLAQFIATLLKEEEHATRGFEAAALSQLKEEAQQKESSFEKEKEALQKELEKWKSEAEQRRIEKAQDERLLTLLQGEMENYTAQKDAIIEDAQKRAPDYEIWQKKIAALQGQYTQLRVQFDSKNEVLSQTRKELFQAQGELIALQKETEQEVAFEIEGLLQYIRDLVMDFKSLENEIEVLEKLLSKE